MRTLPGFDRKISPEKNLHTLAIPADTRAVYKNSTVGGV